MRWTLVLERVTENSLNPDTARRHLRQIAAAAERNQSLAFRGRVGKLAEPELVLEGGQERKRYLVKLRLEESKARNQELAAERFAHVRTVVEKCARSKGWKVLGTQTGQGGGEGGDVPAPAMVTTPFRPPLLTPEVIAREFGDVYGRDEHLRLIDDTVQTFVETGGDLRTHTILHGKPGGCKTTLFERLKALYERDDPGGHPERVFFLDAPTLTKAGLEKWFVQRAEDQILPPVVVVEEMEKCDKDNLLAMGSMMASGYISRTNARDGRLWQECRCLFWATCNDLDALLEFRKGFLLDRMANELYCPLPDEQTMHRILLDKVRRMPGGKPVWADLAMELARKTGETRPRKIIGFLSGRQRLVTGEYQHDKLAVLRAQQREEGVFVGKAGPPTSDGQCLVA